MFRPESPLPSWLARLWALTWAGHALAALAWWVLMPAGFPIAHPLFWANQVLPPLALAVSLAGLAALRLSRPVLLTSLAAGPCAAWAGAACVAGALFPSSATRLVPLLAGPALLLLALTLRLWRCRAGRLLPAATLLLAGLLGGTLMTAAQRGGDPDTRPLNDPLPPMSDSAGPRPWDVCLAPHLTVADHAGRVDLRCGGLQLHVRPLLALHRLSPDRCWTLFAPPDRREAPARRLTAWRRSPSGLHLRYDPGPSTLHVRPGRGAEETLIEAHCQLDAPVYSHLNPWCELSVRGEEPLSLAFSPCPQERFRVEPFGDFLGGRLRLACREAGGMFRVVEASWNDKGPFRTLATGRLARGEPLEIVLFEGDRPACRLRFDDWSAQAGTALSPTAGYRLPVNAVEFSRYRADPPGACTLVLSLAATTVGRGRASVGHAAGTYRNRLSIQPCRR